MSFRAASNARVLKFIRDADGTDVGEMSEVFASEIGVPATMVSSELLHSIKDLENAGLVVKTEENYEPNDIIEYETTELAEDVLSALEISLTRLSRIKKSSIVSEPIFESPGKKDRPDVFVVMPFNEDIAPVYFDHIRPVCDSLGLSAGRADDFFEAKSIVQDIFESIYKSKLVIADCTYKNPNVFYEIGISHTLGNPTILTTQNLDDIPFDLRHIRTIEYNYTPRGMEEFESTLENSIRAELENIG